MTQYVYPHQGYLLNNTSQVRLEHINGYRQGWKKMRTFPGIWSTNLNFLANFQLFLEEKDRNI